MIKVRRVCLLSLLALPALAIAPAAYGQTAANYPDRTVRLLVPYPPGQGADIFARLLAHRLTEKWGQTVFVENKGGGGGVPGMMAGKLATADGYTLVLGGSQSVTVSPNLYAKLPYDPMVDFQPVTGLYAAPLVIVVHPSSGFISLKQLIEAAKKDPGKLLYASAGNGTSQHMTAELFIKTAEIEMGHVAYKGSGPAMTDLLGGQVKIMLDGVASALPHIKSGKIRPLAVTTAERIPQLPDVPTIAELGYPGFSGIGWAGLFLQAAAPKDIAEKVSADVRALLEEPDMRTAIIERGQIPAPSTPLKAAEFVRTDTAKWGEVAKAANIKLE